MKAAKEEERAQMALKITNPCPQITKRQRDELDYVQQWLDECGDGDGWTPNDVIMANYLAWCETNNVQFKKGPKGLAQSLQAKGYKTGVVNL